MILEGKKIVLLRVVSEAILQGAHPRNKVPPLELKYIEALLQETLKLKVELFDQLISQNSDAEAINDINKINPQIILISFTTLERQKIEKFVSAFKREGILLIGVGQGVAGYSQQYRDWLMEHFDLLIPGEPEAILISCIDKFLNGCDFSGLRQAIWNKYLKEGPYIVEDVNTLPIPEYSPLEINQYNSIYPIRSNQRLVWGYVLASRGCPHNCNFCSPCMRKSSGHKIRYRKASLVIAEIEKLMARGVNIISFEDDDFMHSSRQIELICQEIIAKDIKIDWIAHARVDEIDLGIIGIMKKSGCKLLRFGIESGQEQVINCLNKGNGATWRAQTKEALSWVKKYRIAVCAMFIVGNPQETQKDIEDTIRFAKEIQPDSIQVALLEVYPGSILFNSLSSEDKEKILQNPPYHYRDISLNVSSLKQEELLYLHKKFYKDVILNWRYLFGHLSKYLMFYLKNPKVFGILLRGLIDFSIF